DTSCGHVPAFGGLHDSTDNSLDVSMKEPLGKDGALVARSFRATRIAHLKWSSTLLRFLPATTRIKCHDKYSLSLPTSELLVQKLGSLAVIKVGASHKPTQNELRIGLCGHACVKTVGL